MSRHDPIVRVHHMLDHSREAVEMVRNRSRTDLDTDRMLNLALVRLMEIVGEAAAQIPEEFRSCYPQVPWRDVADLRNRLIHATTRSTSICSGQSFRMTCRHSSPHLKKSSRVINSCLSPSHQGAKQAIPLRVLVSSYDAPELKSWPRSTCAGDRSALPFQHPVPLWCPVLAT